MVTKYGDKIILESDNQQYKKTIPLVKTSSNACVMWSQPNYEPYEAFESIFNQHCLLVTKDNANTNDNNYNEDDDSFVEEENHMIKTKFNQ
jgi:hypothetical protein